jgi:hypothetical protein
MTAITGRQRLRQASAFVVASMSAAVMVAACGSASGTGATSAPATASVASTPTPAPVTLTIADFVSNANMVCLNASQYATAEPTPTAAITSFTHPTAADLPAIATYFTSLLALYQGMYTQLQSLGDPPSLQSVWTQALTGYQGVMTDFQSAQSAAGSGDLNGYGAALAKEQTDNTATAQLFTQFGANMCATDAEPSPV